VATQRLDTPVVAHDVKWFGRGWNGNFVLSSVLRGARVRLDFACL